VAGGAAGGVGSGEPVGLSEAASHRHLTALQHSTGGLAAPCWNLCCWNPAGGAFTHGCIGNATQSGGRTDPNDERVALASTPVANHWYDSQLSPEDRGLDCTTHVVFGQPRSLGEAAKTGPVPVDVPCTACNSFDDAGHWQLSA
jgi:hypothetical protein